MFRLPSSLRHEAVVVALQHSWWHAVVPVAVHLGWAEQFTAQPASHVVTVVPGVFFNSQLF